MALPATGAAISIGTVRTYFGLSGAATMSTLGANLSPAVTTNIQLSATFGGWQNPNPTGADG
mgnify:CR=1 FL=1|jgi:hypothetical protein